MRFAANARLFSGRGIHQLHQSPYSPDSNLCDRFLFDWMKQSLRQQAYDSPDEVASAALRVLRSMPEQSLTNELRKLVTYCALVIEAGGNYVTD